MHSWDSEKVTYSLAKAYPLYILMDFPWGRYTDLGTMGYSKVGANPQTSWWQP